jgi:aspartate ammonia-lyase
MGIPRFFMMNVIPELRQLTGLPLSQGENLADATSNLDRWVEVHATLKALAVNLEKMVSDIRLLSSDLAGTKTITIADRQVGSSIMPGKVNPVIAEFIISASHRVYSNDMLVTSLSSQGCLELNAYLPAIGYAVLESIRLLNSSCISAERNLISGLSVNRQTGYDLLMRSPSITTALTPVIGYHKAEELATFMKENGCDIFEANTQTGTIDKKRLEELLQPGNLLKSGFSLEELSLDNP